MSQVCVTQIPNRHREFFSGLQVRYEYSVSQVASYWYSIGTLKIPMRLRFAWYIQVSTFGFYFYTGVFCIWHGVGRYAVN